MSDQPYYPESGEADALGILAQAFTGQEGTGITGGLIERASRYLTGDPAGNINAVSANLNTPAGLPDLPGVKSAILYLGGNSAFARWDGTPPTTGNDFFIPQGSYLILTGVPTLKGFQFVSVGFVAAYVAGCYFT